MSRPRRKLFGPLFYSTLVIAVLSTAYTAVVVGWPTVEESLRKRSVLREEQALIASLRTNDSKVREAIVKALVARRSGAVVKYLLDVAGDQHPELRVLACRYLVDTDADHEVVVAILVAAASDIEEKVRREAALAFGRIRLQRGPRITTTTVGGMVPSPRGESIKALRLLLKDKASLTRIAATDALGQLGPEPEVVADLVAATGDADRDVRFAAARALLKVNPINDRAAARTLVALILDRDPVDDRRAVLDVMMSSSQELQDQAVAALAALLADVDPTIRPDVIDCLVAAGPRARAALPALEGLLKDEDPIHRAIAGLAVATITGQSSPRVTAILLRIIEDLEVPRDWRQSALGKIRELNEADLVKATPILIRQLGSKDMLVRLDALQMLGEILENAPAEMPAPIEDD
jgi:HEAT repeat protein